jgi:hypothetical protein
MNFGCGFLLSIDLHAFIKLCTKQYPPLHKIVPWFFRWSVSRRIVLRQLLILRYPWDLSEMTAQVFDLNSPTKSSLGHCSHFYCLLKHIAISHEKKITLLIRRFTTRTSCIRRVARTAHCPAPVEAVPFSPMFGLGRYRLGAVPTRWG